MGNKYSFSFGECLITEITGITLKQMHFEAKAIVKGYESLKLLGEKHGKTCN